MTNEKEEKAAVIEEIQRGITSLISTEKISQDQNIEIASDVLNSVGHGKRGGAGAIR